MPFAGYENFAACVADQKTQGHGDADARAICGALERDSKPYEGRSAGRAASRYNKSGAGKYRQKSAGYYKRAQKGFVAIKNTIFKAASAAIDSSTLPNSVANREQGVDPEKKRKKKQFKLIRDMVSKAPGDASTPAPPGDQIKGSGKNKPGSAKNQSGGIKVSASTEKTLRGKVKDHNEAMGKADKPPWSRSTLGKLKAVYRRGAGAFSTSHRPGMVRAQWAIARVNAFLYLLKNGRPKNPKYVTDNDLLPSGHPKKSSRKEKSKAAIEKAPQKTFGGVARDDLKDSDFIDFQRRAFPVKTCQDVRDAVSSWGRYKGPLSFETFKNRLIKKAIQIGCRDALPKEWESSRTEIKKGGPGSGVYDREPSREQKEAERKKRIVRMARALSRQRGVFNRSRANAARAQAKAKMDKKKREAEAQAKQKKIKQEKEQKAKELAAKKKQEKAKADARRKKRAAESAAKQKEMQRKRKASAAKARKKLAQQLSAARAATNKKKPETAKDKDRKAEQDKKEARKKKESKKEKNEKKKRGVKLAGGTLQKDYRNPVEA